MNELRPRLRLSLLALLIVASLSGCANDIRHKAELAREEAGYLETNAVEQWAIEWSKVDWDTVTYKDISPYIPEGHAVPKRGWTDPFGNPYVLEAVGQGVAVSAKTIELCAEATRDDPLFWGYHDERVLGLIQAARNGDVDAVQRLVKTVPDPNIPDMRGYKALVVAMARGHDEIEKVLTSNGAVLDPADATPLWLAIDEENVNVVKALINRFPYMVTATKTTTDLWGVSHTGQQALCRALWPLNTEVIRLLLEHGADPNTLDGFPLQVAAGHGRLDIVRLLLEAGAEITPQAREAASRPDRREILKYLDLWSAVREGHLDTVSLLVAGGTQEMPDYFDARLNAAKIQGGQPGSNQEQSSQPSP